MANVPSITLNNGFKMPGFGFGTYGLSGPSGVEAFKNAIDVGYRHFDSAFFYENEKEVGQAVRAKISEGVVKREDMFIVTKVWGIHFRKVEEACLNSLKKLNLAYIDLYLVHWPIGLNYHNEYDTFPHKGNGEPDFDDIDYIEVWSEMEKLVKKGYCKSIGVSNFNSQQLDRLIKHCKIKPVCNQVECSPGVSQRKLINFASNLNLIVTAYCPLGHHIPSSKDPKYLYDKKVIEIAQKYGKSTAQVALRFTVELGAVPLPKSGNNDRMKENIDIFDFKLTEDEMKYLESFSHFENRVCKLGQWKRSKAYPFHIEF